MMTWLAVFAALTLGAGPDRPSSLLRLGGDPARGVLLNHTAGARPTDPIDPARPTVVFVHGFNPAPRAVQFTMAEQLAGRLARRGDASGFNVLGWNWNAATFVSLRGSVNEEAAVAQGWALAQALRCAGAVPGWTHLIGHSSGCIVVASAAQALRASTGSAVAHLTLLEPASIHHQLVFGRLGAGGAASRVENYWAPGPSGYGRAAGYAGVWNQRVAGPTPLLGVVWPLRSAHIDLVHWYLRSAEDRASPAGFNNSLLLVPR